MNSKFKCKISFSLVIVFLLTTFFITGCGEKNKTASASKSSTENKLVFKDGIGREITLDKPAEKIVVFPPCMSYVCALDSENKIVGAGTKKNIELRFVKKIIPNIAEIPDCLGNTKNPNIEQIMSLKPDLVIMSASMKGNLEILENSGVKVFIAVGEDIEGIKDTILNLSIALGKEEIGEKFIKYYDNTIAMVKDRVKDIKNEDKPKVYFAGSDILNTCSDNMYQNFMIDISGGRNVSSELHGNSWVKISPEQILKWNPDIIFIPQYSRTIGPEDVLKDPRWKNISAVKNKKVYRFPSNLIPWDYPSVQTVLGVLWTAKTINLEKFKDVDINKESNEFFKGFFGKDFAELGGKLEK
ncbi:ABC transporter substrate-binding protein [Clostridium ganghwense]|uniref:ABC transporter substrate-binding protein n=1 Tax=Clostridium ganghwense TaxID=312089 RepID=A0ABT4CL62_9CLOT|nr:ABC transporter substrate-binding protein [Clostridium ganghwense]MCY6369784.1 ABC transporter substrate-binding protein [Clostridium ganghwense]